MRRLVALFAAATLGLAPAAAADAQSEGGAPPVRAVLFFLPTCGHCHQVITEDLPVIFDQYGGPWEVSFDESLPEDEVTFYLLSNATLQLLMVDASVGSGGRMLLDAGETVGVPESRLGSVPLMVIGDTFLIGSVDIPSRFPEMIDEALAGSPIGWPEVPGMDAAIAAIPALAAAPPATTTTAPPVTTTTPGADATATTEAAVVSGDVPVGDDDGDSIADRIGRDPFGNGIAIAVLAAMVLSLVTLRRAARGGILGRAAPWAVPVLGVIGLGVSIYLASVEASGSAATCGPVGDCNAVQSSEYATLLGVPIGVIGIAGYALVLCGWLVAGLRAGSLADWARLAVGAVALGGTVFSIYLTFLEPFVIGAACVWCLTSAASITLLLWVSAAPAWAAYRRLRRQSVRPAR